MLAAGMSLVSTGKVAESDGRFLAFGFVVVSRNDVDGGDQPTRCTPHDYPHGNGFETEKGCVCLSVQPTLLPKIYACMSSARRLCSIVFHS